MLSSRFDHREHLRYIDEATITAIYQPIATDANWIWRSYTCTTTCTPWVIAAKFIADMSTTGVSCGDMCTPWIQPCTRWELNLALLSLQARRREVSYATPIYIYYNNKKTIQYSSNMFMLFYLYYTTPPLLFLHC